MGKKAVCFVVLSVLSLSPLVVHGEYRAPSSSLASLKTKELVERLLAGDDSVVSELASRGREALVELDAYSFGKLPAGVGKVFADLGDDHFAVREKAQNALIAMGIRIIPLTRAYMRAHSDDPEVSQRCREIIDACEKNRRKRLFQAFKIVVRMPPDSVKDLNLGSLPGKVEKILVSDDKNIARNAWSMLDVKTIAEFMFWKWRKTGYLGEIPRAFSKRPKDIVEETVRNILASHPLQESLPVIAELGCGIAYSMFFDAYWDKLSESDWKKFLHDCNVFEFYRCIENRPPFPQALTKAIQSFKDSNDTDLGCLYLIYSGGDWNVVNDIFHSSKSRRSFCDKLDAQLTRSRISAREAFQLFKHLSLPAFAGDASLSYLIGDRTVEFLLGRIKTADRKTIADWLRHSAIHSRFFELLLKYFPFAKEELKSAAKNYFNDSNSAKLILSHVEYSRKILGVEFSRREIIAKWESIVEGGSSGMRREALLLANDLGISEELQLRGMNVEKLFKERGWDEWSFRILHRLVLSRKRRISECAADKMLEIISTLANKLDESIEKRKCPPSSWTQTYQSLQEFGISAEVAAILVERACGGKELSKVLAIIPERTLHLEDYCLLAWLNGHLSPCDFRALAVTKRYRREVLDFIEHSRKYGASVFYILALAVTNPSDEERVFLRKKIMELICAIPSGMFGNGVRFDEMRLLGSDLVEPSTFLNALFFAARMLNARSPELSEAFCDYVKYYDLEAHFPYSYLAGPVFEDTIPSLLAIAEKRKSWLPARMAIEIDPDNEKALEYIRNLMLHSDEEMLAMSAVAYLSEINRLPPFESITDERLKFLASLYSKYDDDDCLVQYAGRNDRDDDRILKFTFASKHLGCYSRALAKIAERSPRRKSLILKKLVTYLGDMPSRDGFMAVFSVLSRMDVDIPDPVSRKLKRWISEAKLTIYGARDILRCVAAMGPRAASLAPLIESGIKNSPETRKDKAICLLSISPSKKKRDRCLLELYKMELGVEARTIDELTHVDYSILPLDNFRYYASDYYLLSGRIPAEYNDAIMRLRAFLTHSFLSRDSRGDNYFDVAIPAMRKMRASERLFSVYREILKAGAENNENVCDRHINIVLEDIFERYPERVPECARVLAPCLPRLPTGAPFDRLREVLKGQAKQE